MLNQYLVNSRGYSTIYPLEQELNLTKENYLFDLDYLSCIQINGDKTREFLQGQLSCDIHAVHSSQMQHGAMCNLQGRILALVDVLDWQGMHLILPKDLNHATQTTLTKTAILSKVTLTSMTEYRLFGVYVGSPEQKPSFDLPTRKYAVVSGENQSSYAIDDNLYIIIAKKSWGDHLWENYNLQMRRGALAWHWLQIQQQNIEIYPSTRGIFLPHRLNLHLNDYLSFDKGCYKGQEIIARTHYRATLKHTLKLFKVKTEIYLQAGQKLFINEQEIGELVDYCPGGNHTLILISALFEHNAEVILRDAEKNYPLTLEPI